MRIKTKRGRRQAFRVVELGITFNHKDYWIELIGEFSLTVFKVRRDGTEFVEGEVVSSAGIGEVSYGDTPT